ncbi:hypothetical protein EMIT0111MI5_140180 [Burkholderia sp. IT-111MI5]
MKASNQSKGLRIPFKLQKILVQLFIENTIILIPGNLIGVVFKPALNRSFALMSEWRITKIMDQPYSCKQCRYISAGVLNAFCNVVAMEERNPHASREIRDLVGMGQPIAHAIVPI